MTHNYHESLDGYDPNQLLHDGCAECEARGVGDAIAKLDSDRFPRAWARAAEMQVHGLRNASRAELPLLQALAMVQVQFERRGIPLGVLPSAITAHVRQENTAPGQRAS